MIVTYDPERLDWDEVLEKARASRPPNDGMLVAIPRGGRLHREILKSRPPRGAGQRVLSPVFRPKSPV
jgi:hypothetical protein